MEPRAPCPRTGRQCHLGFDRVHPAIGGRVEARQYPLHLDQREQVLDFRWRNLRPLQPLRAHEICIALHPPAPCGIAGRMAMAALPKARGKGRLCLQINVKSAVVLLDPDQHVRRHLPRKQSAPLRAMKCPEVSLSRSSTTTSRRPSRPRWRAIESPMTPPPIITTGARSGRVWVGRIWVIGLTLSVKRDRGRKRLRSVGLDRDEGSKSMAPVGMQSGIAPDVPAVFH